MFEPLQYEFFVRGLVAATLAGALCGLVGVYIVLRRMAYIGHGLSHAIFGGAVASAFLNVNFLVGASAWGFVSALLINLATRRRQIGADAAIGIVTTASFAVGIALISRYRTFTRSYDAALFGNVLGVSSLDLWAIVGVGMLALVAIVAGYKYLLFSTFEPEVARYYGVPTGLVDTAFAFILAAVIVVSLQVLGVTLIAAAIVIPPVIARLLTSSFGKMMALSVAIGGATGLAGIYGSYYVDVASGAAVVLLGAALFVVVLGLTSLRRNKAPARG